MAQEPTDLLTLTEAGEVLRVHRLVVGQYIRAGKLPAVRGQRREWLVRRSDLDAYLFKTPYEPRRSVQRRQPRQTDGREWLETLAAAGWSDEQICAAVGMRPETLVRSRRRGVMTSHRGKLRRLADEVARQPDLQEALRRPPGPSGVGAIELR